MLLAKLYLNAGGLHRHAELRRRAGVGAGRDCRGRTRLDTNFLHMFKADNNTSPEIIFAIPQDGLKTQTWGGVTFLVHASCGGSMSATAYGIDGCWWGLRLKPQAYNRYSAGDNRASYLLHVRDNRSRSAAIGNFTDGIAAPKFMNVTSTGAAGSHPTHVDTDFPMFRLADAYLIYAEAHLRGGGGTASQALTYVNALRQRAYGNASGNITAAQLTLDFVLAERGRELLWEGHRRTDLVRYGRFTGGIVHLGVEGWYAGRLVNRCEVQPVSASGERARREPESEAESWLLRKRRSTASRGGAEIAEEQSIRRRCGIAEKN